MHGILYLKGAFASVMILLIVTSLIHGSINYSGSFSTGADSTPAVRRTRGSPVSGFWNRTYGTGALPEAIAGALASTSPPPSGVPSSFSWNGYFGGANYMTPVKDQGACGSCWAFASVGDMEAQYQINIANPGTGIDLSEQNVLSCSGGTCSGWYLGSTLDFLKNLGAPDETCNPYTATETPCGTGRCSDYLSRTYHITTWTWISTDTANIKNNLYTHGPVMVWMPVFDDFPWYDATFWQYYFYAHAPSGTYGGHFVVIVGWDDQAPGTGDDYWIVRNSWGTSGGDVNSGYGGYFYMTQDATYGFFGIYQEAAVISDVTSPVTFMTNPAIWPGSPGSITVDSVSTYVNGQTGYYTGTHTVTANPPTGYTFGSWAASGMLSVASPSSNPATLTVNGSGTLTANFNPVNPFLFDGSVDPSSGSTSTSFSYYVVYYDPKGLAPTVKRVWIDGGSHDMLKYGGSPSSGIYIYPTTLSVGSHDYYFEFSDGTNTVRLPTSGSYSGPVVSPATGDFTILSNPRVLRLVRPSSGTVSKASSICLNSINGFSSDVALSGSWIDDAPTGITYSFNLNPVTPPANGQVTSTLTVSVDSTALGGVYVLSIIGTSGSITHTCYVVIVIEI